MFRFQLNDTSELRLLQPYHADELFALTDANRAYLRQWLPWLDGVQRMADTAAFIKGTLKQFGENNGFQAGIWYRDKLAGVIGYHTIDWSDRATELGYWLGETYQGRGLVTQAARALTDYAFAELGLNRLEIRCATGNVRSCAVPQRLGYTHEGVVRQAEWLYDHFVDHNVYGMLAEDWQ